jgi:ADP-ribose pyrophosphatase YjhB (NUDIX family)
MNFLIKTYTEDGYRPIPAIRLSDKEYGRGLQCFVPVCTDVIPIDRRHKKIYLTDRRSKPITGLWWIGGKMMPAETKEESAARAFKRETKLDLPLKRFKLAAIFDYRWKDRAQKPKDLGCHMLAYTFTVELKPKELLFVSTHLDPKEYNQKNGLTAFTQKELVKAKVFPVILDLYDHLFPR